ncbi:4Fe-4S ferredoxin iron-sulfur binding domain protein [Lachnoclostridium phytofermentans ISDg]|uniref:4Fe-4S ferredoxin iron-sulfur binding domain protein n=1 Tax=Lachnoclostridium phytofermentans (strain ATCC 700394 / DSM 18823 / ISDg) TaxID=357809 RepID=A9KRH3_LACP7|nr:4Fe-4S ferredoxin iron-sulfur binding domain protein [Lachnoclostridium phytofermentans ISDg]
MVLVKKFKRTIIQCLSAVLMNANVAGFWKGKIYTGKSKNLCLPILNCYSCPGALGACPIGSLQVSAGSSIYGISFYVLGFLALMGILFGRLLCGFLCPFGFIQDLLHKVPLLKLKIPQKLERIMRFGKYLVLAILVVLLPLLAADSYGSTVPFFCKYLCPAGTLEGGIPLVSMNKPLQATIGWLFSWKILILAVVILSSMMIFRPFCKYLCPLGAFYSLFNRFSFYRYYIDRNKCTDCGICGKICPMNVEPVKTPNHTECIRCGLCKNKCPQNAIQVEKTLK